MQIGTALFLLAVGAILKYAVTDSVDGINLETVGVILMVAGAVGIVLSLFMMSRARDATVVHERRDRISEDPRV
jgi:hypothetical protein